MRSAPIQLANATSMGASFNTYGVELNQMLAYSIHAYWTGSTAVGTFDVQVSNDHVPPASGANIAQPNQAANVVNWTNYTGTTVAVSGAGSFMWNSQITGYRWVRLAYTRTSGTGSCTVNFDGKG